MKSDIPWKTLASKTVFENPWMKIQRNEIVHETGIESTYDVIEQKTDFVLVIPVIDQTFYLVDQYRYPTKERSLEFPEGGLKEGEIPLEGAKRELAEETGLTSSNIKQLGFLHLANGNQTQGFFVFLAEDCTEGASTPDETEADLVVKKFQQKEIEELIRNGMIKDGPTVASWSLYVLS